MNHDQVVKKKPGAERMAELEKSINGSGTRESWDGGLNHQIFNPEKWWFSHSLLAKLLGWTMFYP